MNGHDFFTRQLSGYFFTPDSMRLFHTSGKNERASGDGAGRQDDGHLLARQRDESRQRAC